MNIETDQWSDIAKQLLTVTRNNSFAGRTDRVSVPTIFRDKQILTGSQSTTTFPDGLEKAWIEYEREYTVIPLASPQGEMCSMDISCSCIN